MVKKNLNSLKKVNRRKTKRVNRRKTKRVNSKKRIKRSYRSKKKTKQRSRNKNLRKRSFKKHKSINLTGGSKDPTEEKRLKKIQMTINLNVKNAEKKEDITDLSNYYERSVRNIEKIRKLEAAINGNQIVKRLWLEARKTLPTVAEETPAAPEAEKKVKFLECKEGYPHCPEGYNCENELCVQEAESTPRTASEEETEEPQEAAEAAKEREAAEERREVNHQLIKKKTKELTRLINDYFENGEVDFESDDGDERLQIIRQMFDGLKEEFRKKHKQMLQTFFGLMLKKLQNKKKLLELTTKEEFKEFILHYEILQILVSNGVDVKNMNEQLELHYLTLEVAIKNAKKNLKLKIEYEEAEQERLQAEAEAQAQAEAAAERAAQEAAAKKREEEEAAAAAAAEKAAELRETRLKTEREAAAQAAILDEERQLNLQYQNRKKGRMGNSAATQRTISRNLSKYRPSSR